MTRIGLLGLSLLVSVPLAASDLLVTIVSPDLARPVFGNTTVEVEIRDGDFRTGEAVDAKVDRVELYVDYQLVATRREPPWRASVDVGEENVEHTIEAVVHPVVGEPSTSRILTPAVRVDSEIDVRLRQLFVTVTRNGDRLLDLERGDFEIEDAGTPQRVVTFARGEVPFTAVLLVDASSSMIGGKLSIAVTGAGTFAESMQPLDEAKLLLFSDRRLAESPFTNIGSLFELGLAGIEPGGGTALNDTLFLALARLGQREGRRVVVLLSDGVDVDSVLSMRQVEAVARRSETLLYWIRLGRSSGEMGSAGASYLSSWRDRSAHSRELRLLARTVGDSGGRIVEVDSPDEIGPAFESVLRDLRGQYVLGYYPRPDPAPGEWREVEVRVRRRGVDVRAPEGYVAVE